MLYAIPKYCLEKNKNKIKCCFSQFFNSPVALKNKKIFGPPRKSWNDAPERGTVAVHMGRLVKDLMDVCKIYVYKKYLRGIK